MNIDVEEARAAAQQEASPANSLLRLNFHQIEPQRKLTRSVILPCVVLLAVVFAERRIL